HLQPAVRGGLERGVLEHRDVHRLDVRVERRGGRVPEDADVPAALTPGGEERGEEGRGPGHGKSSAVESGSLAPRVTGDSRSESPTFIASASRPGWPAAAPAPAARPAS